MGVDSKFQKSEMSKKAVLGSVIILVGLTIFSVTQLDYNTSEQVENPSVTVSVKNYSCITHENRSVCYNEKNKSEVNLSKLTDK